MFFMFAVGFVDVFFDFALMDAVFEDSSLFRYELYYSLPFWLSLWILKLEFEEMSFAPKTKPEGNKEMKVYSRNVVSEKKTEKVLKERDYKVKVTYSSSGSSSSSRSSSGYHSSGHSYHSSSHRSGGGGRSHGGGAGGRW